MTFDPNNHELDPNVCWRDQVGIPLSMPEIQAIEDRDKAHTPAKTYPVLLPPRPHEICGANVGYVGVDCDSNNVVVRGFNSSGDNSAPGLVNEELLGGESSKGLSG